ncbi:hypothetical protein AAGS61_02100 [Lysinibacillus sp. KU-BSD001]|uniref:hypothetical protein n=1 Tax=Lysinibacillus sp. KU-BSD001 TaxID=3141328 RepID=UPI0036EC98AD
MRKSTLWQNTAMIAVSFIAGVAFFQLFSLEQATQVINIMDKRILLEKTPTIWQSMLPLAITVSIVLLFATHPYFFGLAKIAIAIKTCFFGFSSVYLLAQKNELLAYGIWWFPFQFLYIVVLVLLCEFIASAPKFAKNKERSSLRISVTFFILISLIFFVEIVVISYVFK